MSTAALMAQFTSRESTPFTGLKGKLELDFVRDHTGVRMIRQAHNGPLVVQQPLYPEGPGVCHTCVLHPSGVLAGSDRLLLSARAEPDAHALLTTPGAVKMHRNDGLFANIRREFHVDGGASLEWLPQEQILFNGAHCATSNQIVLETGSRFIGWEITGLGLPAAGKHFESGSCGLRCEIWHQDRPLLLEHTRLRAEDPLLSAPWGLGGRTVIGSLLAFPGSRFLLESLRTLQSAGENALVSATLLDGLLVCRYLGHHIQQAKELFHSAWERIRPQVIGLMPERPRAWDC